MARYHSDPWDTGLTDEDTAGLTRPMPELGDLENWQNQSPMGQPGRPDPTEYLPDEMPHDIYTAQATKDPIDEMLERADKGEAIRRPAYLGEQDVQTRAISQPPAATKPTPDNPHGETWGQYIRRTLLGA